MNDMTLLIDPEKRDLVFDNDGIFKKNLWCRYCCTKY